MAASSCGVFAPPPPPSPWGVRISYSAYQIGQILSYCACGRSPCSRSFQVNAGTLLRGHPQPPKYGPDFLFCMPNRTNFVLLCVRQEPLFQKFPVNAGPLLRGLVSCTGAQFCGIALIETKNRAQARGALSLGLSPSESHHLDLVRKNEPRCLSALDRKTTYPFSVTSSLCPLVQGRAPASMDQ
jgi:hypothetical protein